eukprot:jgi/Ulvmu1/1181/UM108_0009.1
METRPPPWYTDTWISVQQSGLASMRQCLPITRHPQIESSQAEPVSEHVLLNVARGSDDEDAVLTVSAKVVPSEAIARSPVLQELREVLGETSMPFSNVAFWSWVDAAASDARPTKVEICCINIEVAAFLQDDAMVEHAALRIAHALRAALRADIADSGAISAPNRAPDIELPPFLAAADAAQASLVFPRLPPCLTLDPGPHLAEFLDSSPLQTLSAPVLDAIASHLHLYETLSTPVALRAAALAAALRDGTLDLAALAQLNPVSAPDPVPLLAIFRTLQPCLPVCAPITALRVPAAALCDRATNAALVSHVPELQHLTICGGFATLEHPAVTTFLNRLPSRQLQSLDFCECRNLPLSAHVWQNTCLYGLDMPPPVRWLRTQLNRIRPPRHPKLHPKLAQLRSLNVHLHSQDPAMIEALPMRQLTRLRIAISDNPNLLRPSHPAALAASTGPPSAHTVAVEAATLTTLAAALHDDAAVLRDLHLDICLATLSSADAGRELRTLADVVCTRETLRSLGFLLRDCNHTQRGPVFTQLSRLTALQRLTFSKAALVAPHCLRALPALTAVEFLRPDGALHPETAARTLVALEGLSRVDRLVLPGPLSMQEFRIGVGDAAGTLRPLRAIRCVGALEGYRRLSGTCLASHQYTCHCWDPSGYEALSAQIVPDVAEDPQGRVSVDDDDNDDNDDNDDSGSSGGADVEGGDRDEDPSDLQIVSAAMLSGDRVPVQEDGPMRVPGMENVRALRLYVREGASMDGALNCIMSLDRLERVEVTGIEMWPWVGGFLGALRAVAPLTHVVLHGCEGYATRLLEELEVLPRLSALVQLDMMVTVVDRGFLGVPREAEVSGRTHSARRGNSAKLARLREKCEAVEERWRALIALVERRVADAAAALPALATVRVHLECPAMESVAHKLLR